MPLFTHIKTLEDKHSQLDNKITTETMRPLPDFTLITSLKKQKLLIKEEINRLLRMQLKRKESAS